MSGPLQLLYTRRFFPLFITQFLGAFNDNLFKNALLILITYHIAEKAQMDPALMVTAIAGIFIFPFFLFSATAGQIADKHEKSRLIKMVKVAEIIIMLIASLGFYFIAIDLLKTGTYLLLFVLFLMGTQSTFFGPLKYSILPDHLTEQELVGGNGLIEAATFIAILLGTIVGGLLILTDQGIMLVSLMIITLAVIGWITSRAIPHSPPAAPNLHVKYNVIKETWNIMDFARKNRSVYLSIIGISWFWFVGATFLSQFAPYAKFHFAGNEEVVTLFLAVFSIGIAVGSLLCHKLTGGEVDARYVPAGTLGMSIFIIDIFIASPDLITAETLANMELIGFSAFLNSGTNLRILFDLFAVAVCGGIYIVPLYAIMQARCEKSHRARTIASNNVLNALFMVVSAIAIAIMLQLSFTTPLIFISLAIVNGFVFFVIRKLTRERIAELNELKDNINNKQ